MSRHWVYVSVVGLLAGGALGLWAGRFPFLLIVLLGCLLMMVMTIRGGTHGVMLGGPAESDPAGGEERTHHEMKATDPPLTPVAT